MRFLKQIVGALSDNSFDGSAYVFDVATGQQLFKLEPNDGCCSANFGGSTAISGTTAIIGAPHDDGFAGSAYIFATNTGQQLHNLWFGTHAERQSQNWVNIRDARKRVFRYCIFANEMEAVNGEHPGGIAELPGNDFYITLGVFNNPSDWFIGFVFMHELGHTLNLQHGGTDSINAKPNYISVMNYSFPELNYESTGNQLMLDYSREPLLPLDESNLNETEGITSVEYADVLSLYSRDDGNGGRTRVWVTLDYVQWDWNQDGKIDQSVAVDLNWLNGNDDASPGELLYGGSDWEQLVLPLGTDGDYADYIHDTAEEPRLTKELYDWLAENVPPSPAGAADLASVIAVTGTILDGDIADLQQSDEAFVQTRSDFGQTTMELIVAATSDTVDPTSMSVLIESRIDQPVGTAELRLRNWTTGQFDNIGQYAISDSESTNWLDEIDATDYVDTNGEIELSIKSKLYVPIPFNRFTFESLIDRVQITALN